MKVHCRFIKTEAFGGERKVFLVNYSRMHHDSMDVVSGNNTIGGKCTDVHRYKEFTSKGEVSMVEQSRIGGK